MTSPVLAPYDISSEVKVYPQTHLQVSNMYFKCIVPELWVDCVCFPSIHGKHQRYKTMQKAD